MDVIAATTGLLVATPFLLVGAIVIYLSTGGPAFFRQRRVGQYGKLFELIKFRTMVQDAAEKGPSITSSKDPRITRVGKWLRRAKIDEIPQLINVLRGEMSLVGPRPELPVYVAMYTSGQCKVLELKPGLTGPASLAFIDEEELLSVQADAEDFYRKELLGRKLQLDLAYCREVTFRRDLKLVCDTLVRLVKTRKGTRAGSQS